MNKNWLRILGMILSGLLLVLILAYVGGIVAQFLAHQQEWQAAGGLINSGVRVAKMSFNPIVVLSFAFTGSGIRLIGLEILLIGSFIAYQTVYKWRKRKFYDDQNYIRSDRGTYGNARWLDRTDIKTGNVLALEKPRTAEGVILGEFYDRTISPVARSMLRAKGECELVTMPQDTSKTNLNGHMIVFGSSGSGKSRWLRNQLFQAIKNGQSVVVTDPKGELFVDTALMFYRAGYTVRMLNLKDPNLSYQWNPFSYIDPDDTLMCTRLATMIIANTSNGKASDPFFENGEEALLGMLIIYMLNREGASEEEKTFRYLLSLLNEDKMKRLEAEISCNPYHPAFSAYQKYKRQPKTQQDSFATGLYVRLHLLEDERLSNMITESIPDLAIDLERPAYEKCAYFISIPIHDTSLEFVSSMFFTLLISRLEKYAETHPNEKGEAKCPLVVNLYLDEFCNIGKLGQDEATIEQMLSTIRSYNLRMLIIVQSLGQLEYKYGGPLAKAILANCGIQILLACNDPSTAQYFSDRCGQLTTVVESTRVTKRTMAIAQIIPSYGESQGEGKRALMPYDAIMTLRKDPRRKYRMLVAAQGQPVLDLDAFDYTRHWMSKEIEPISIEDFMRIDLQDSKAKREAQEQALRAQQERAALLEAERDLARRERAARESAIISAQQQAEAAQAARDKAAAELEAAKAEAERAKAELAAAQEQAAKARAEREEAEARAALAKASAAKLSFSEQTSPESQNPSFTNPDYSIPSAQNPSYENFDFPLQPVSLRTGVDPAPDFQNWDFERSNSRIPGVSDVLVSDGHFERSKCDSMISGVPGAPESGEDFERSKSVSQMPDAPTSDDDVQHTESSVPEGGSPGTTDDFERSKSDSVMPGVTEPVEHFERSKSTSPMTGEPIPAAMLPTSVPGHSEANASATDAHFERSKCGGSSADVPAPGEDFERSKSGKPTAPATPAKSKKSGRKKGSIKTAMRTEPVEQLTIPGVSDKPEPVVDAGAKPQAAVRKQPAPSTATQQPKAKKPKASKARDFFSDITQENE